MKVKVVGIQLVSYTSRKTNQLVEGNTLHCVKKAERAGDVGELTETVFVSKNSNAYPQIAKINVGTEVDIYYNRYGSVEDISVPDVENPKGK